MSFNVIELDVEERRALRAKSRAALLDALRAAGGEARRKELLATATARAAFSPRELAAPPPEKAAGQYATLVDHTLSWSLTQLKRDGLVENPAWSVWRLAGAAAEPAPPTITQPLALDRLVELREMPYRQYLRTPEWRRTRAAALERAGNACSLDATHTQDLEVHHRTYERLGAELPGDVVVLCRTCHRVHHAAHGRPGRAKGAGGAGAAKRSAGARGPKRRSLLARLLAG